MYNLNYVIVIIFNCTPCICTVLHTSNNNNRGIYIYALKHDKTGNIF